MRYSAVHSGADLVLAPGVTVTTGGLLTSMGQRHPVDPLGELVARHCVKPIPDIELTETMQALVRAPHLEVSSGLQRYLLQLHDKRLISVHQSFLLETVWELLLWPFDAMTLVLTRRRPLLRFSSRRIYPPTIRSLVRAVIESHVFVTVAGLIVAVAVIVGTDLFRPLAPLLMLDRSAILGLLVSSVCLLYLATGFVHELAHLMTAHLLGVPVLGVQARRGAASVLVDPVRGRTARWVLISGPVAGALFAAVVALAVLDPLRPGWDLLVIDNVRQSIALIAVLLVPAHLLSLCPWFPDGRTIRVLSRGEADHVGA